MGKSPSMRHLPAILLLCSASHAFANDSTAELATSGLILSRTDVIAMEREELSISADRIDVSYVFRNGSDADIETVVAFPMPDIERGADSDLALPNGTSDNFLDFQVSVGGKPVSPTLEQRAFAVGIDVTAELQGRNIPLNPFADAVPAALAALPQDVADQWLSRGMLVIDEYDDGSGWKRVRSPSWRLKSTYWWRSVFPANSTVGVDHRYKPSLGMSAGLNFLTDGALAGETYAAYKRRYCFDKSFESAVLKAAKSDPDGYPHYSENRISYILTTGGNWATGLIGDFKLTVDKGSPKNLVSFCGKDVVKTGATTFEMTASDFYPDRDLDILVLVPYGNDAGSDGAEPSNQ